MRGRGYVQHDGWVNEGCCNSEESCVDFVKSAQKQSNNKVTNAFGQFLWHTEDT